MKNIKIYCITDLQCSPVCLNRREGSSNLYGRVPLPLPEQVVVFALGEWANKEKKLKLNVIVEIGNGTVVPLGILTNKSRCLVWEKSRSKVNLDTNGASLGKLVVEVHGDTDQSLITDENSENINMPELTKEEDLEETSSTMQDENENTPQFFETMSPLPKKVKKSKKRQPPGELDSEGSKSKKQTTRLRSIKEFCTPKNSKGSSDICANVLTQKNILETKMPGPKMSYCKDVSGRAPNPTSRWGSSLCMFHNNKAVLIGGQGDKQQLNKDAVWVLDPCTRRWKYPTVTNDGLKVEYRMGHTAVYDPMIRGVYVYGGSKNCKWFNDVHFLDVDEWKWQLVKVNGKAPTRAYHSSTLYRHELWVFGGVYPRPDPHPDGCSNDIHIFSPVLENWYSPIVTGEKPLARSGHSATLINDRLVVFGGWDAPIPYNDLYILDMSTVDWSKPDVLGTPPIPRSWHASCSLSNNRILIHGGYDGNNALADAHIFNLDTLSWMEIAMDLTPLARTGHQCLCLPYYHENQEEDEVLMFGGGDNDGNFFNDLYSICISFNPVTHTSKLEAKLMEIE
ncbi:acyl-CoA-binding domain-containing protein 5-like [Gigantopelta aegis]|uniref:acyl-CoA-binding domain-containing protein 5-like n=1 Tax=Gigantopelta aegis TaxID=1735272 RepID=UPI001B88E562|nr:acyl-CoA-binding domain-containing protein 5-like [Gigantopelta aegis]